MRERFHRPGEGFPRMPTPPFRGCFVRSLIPRLAIACGLATHPGSGAASSLEVQDQNVNTGLFAARVGVASSCDAELHEVLTGPIGAGDYVGCSTLTADADLASGAATFTAGDLVILRNGFQVAAEASLTVEIDRALYPDAWVQDDTPDGETIYSARFHVDASGLDFASSLQRFFHFAALDGAGRPEFRIGLKRTGTEKRLFFEVFQDDGSLATTEDSLEFLVSPGWHRVEVGWAASSSPADQQGSGFICLDSPAPPQGCVVLSSLDNDTGAEPGSSVLAGPLSVSGAGTGLSLESFTIDTTNLATPYALRVTDGAVVYPASVVVMPEPGGAILGLGAVLLEGLARSRRRALPPAD